MQKNGNTIKKIIFHFSREEIKVDIPIICPFKDDDKYYCYDPFSNNIIRLSKNHYTEIKKLIAMGKTEYIANADNTWGSPARDIVFLLNTNKYFREQLFQVSIYPDMELISGLYDRSIHDLALQITRNCNFTCRYCQYATKNGISRTHENANMSDEIAQKAVDFLMKHSGDANQVNIAFCGGEPLLNFNLIHRIMQYIKEKYTFRLVTYNLTSNVSLLKEEHVDIFEKNGLQLMVSFDGPETVQNYNRKFRANGEGTYSIVMKNVMQLMRKHRKYFEKNVSFNAVYLNESQKEYAEQFFRDLGILNKVRLVGADLNGIDYQISNRDSSGSPHEIENRRNTEWYIDREKKIKNRRSVPSRWHHDGPCIPGIRRLFVDTNGNFFPCEKSMETSGLSIGSLDSGIDIKSALKLLNIGALTSEECKRCFAFRFCSICCSHCVDSENNCLSSTCKFTECENQKRIAIAFLHEFVH